MSVISIPRKITIGILLGLLLISTLFVPARSVPGNTLSFTLLQGIASTLALMIGLMALLRYYSRKKMIYLILGSSFLGVCTLEGYQMLAGTYWFAIDFPSTNDRLIPWCWMLTQTFLSLMMLGIWLFLRLHPHPVKDYGKHEKRVYTLSLLTVMLAFGCFSFYRLPQANLLMIAPLHRPLEYIPALLYLIALVGMIRNLSRYGGVMRYSLVFFLLIMGWAESVITPFSANIHDMHFLVAHLLKILSYLILLVALLVSMYHSFQDLETANKAQISLAEELEQKNAALNNSNRELEFFAYTASHDLQEPLRKILAFGDYLNRSEAKLPEREQDFLNRMIAASQRMGQLINHLLTYSRVNTATITPKQINLEKMLKRIQTDLLDDCEFPDARIHWPSLPYIEADPVQLEQVFRNLISNGLKYCVPERKPEISIWCCHAVTSDNGEMVEIHVADNGIGIAVQYREQVFQMFKRLHGRGQYSGSGIGLSIVKRIIQRHGGRIEIRDNHPVGTDFVVIIPVRQVSLNTPD